MTLFPLLAISWLFNFYFTFFREGTFFLVIDQFNDEASEILSGLRSHPKSLFLYLKTVFEVHLYGTFDLSYVRNDDINGANGKRVKNVSKGLEAYISRVTDFPKMLRSNPIHVTDDMIEQYLEVSAAIVRLAFIPSLMDTV